MPYLYLRYDTPFNRPLTENEKRKIRYKWKGLDKSQNLGKT